MSGGASLIPEQGIFLCNAKTAGSTYRKNIPPEESIARNTEGIRIDGNTGRGGLDPGSGTNKKALW